MDPVIEVILFECKDVITTSCGSGIDELNVLPANG